MKCRFCHWRRPVGAVESMAAHEAACERRPADVAPVAPAVAAPPPPPPADEVVPARRDAGDVEAHRVSLRLAEYELGRARRTLGLLDLVETARVLNLSTPDLRAQAYDRERAGTELWCDDHERPLDGCQAAARKLNVVCGCVGVPLPKVTDPTGDAVAAGPSVFAEVREAARRANRIRLDADWLAGFTARHAATDTPPAVEADLEARNRTLCARHLRYGHERPARSKGTKVRRRDGSYVLSEPLPLCEWCEDVTRDLGHLATEQMIAAHVAGRKLRRPA
ncbi:MAG TPA: hypothetical protein VFU14_20375 [Acidimicrobiales bacterium]|nr:hypothetical protein [Acidimicrobiales bacterium]